MHLVLALHENSVYFRLHLQGDAHDVYDDYLSAASLQHHLDQPRDLALPAAAAIVGASIEAVNKANVSCED